LTKTSFEQARAAMLKNAKEGMKNAFASEEYALIQAINAYLEISKAYNLSFERLTEWYGLYFPELRVSNPKTLADLAIALNSEVINKEAIAAALKDEKYAEEVYSRASSTIGRHMNEAERTALVRFAKLSNELVDTLDALDAYIKKVSTELMPNTVYLTDEKIAAELLSKAGSMERLAVLPASTIQLLGAEKSLFKHLKFGSKPPKYGLIFKLPDVSGGPKDQRGRIARMYAAKISIALKSDYFTKNFIAEKLKADLKSGIERMKSEPPRNHERRQWSRPQRPWYHRPQRQDAAAEATEKQWVHESAYQEGGQKPSYQRSWEHRSGEHRPWDRRPQQQWQRPPSDHKPQYSKQGDNQNAKQGGQRPWERKNRPWMRKQGQRPKTRGKRKA
jgi:nucleolar protein 56